MKKTCYHLFRIPIVIDSFFVFERQPGPINWASVFFSFMFFRETKFYLVYAEKRQKKKIKRFICTFPHKLEKNPIRFIPRDRVSGAGLRKF